MRPKLLKLVRKNFSKILDTKGGEPIFQVWDGEKKGGGPRFLQNLRQEPKPYTLCNKVRTFILIVRIKIWSNVSQKKDILEVRVLKCPFMFVVLYSFPELFDNGMGTENL